MSRDGQYSVGPHAAVGPQKRCIGGNERLQALDRQPYLISSEHDASDHLFGLEPSRILHPCCKCLVSPKYITSRRKPSVFGPNEPSARQETLELYFRYKISDPFGVMQWVVQEAGPN